MRAIYECITTFELWGPPPSVRELSLRFIHTLLPGTDSPKLPEDIYKVQPVTILRVLWLKERIVALSG